MNDKCKGCKYETDPLAIPLCLNCKWYYDFKTTCEDLYEPKKQEVKK